MKSGLVVFMMLTYGLCSAQPSPLTLTRWRHVEAIYANDAERDHTFEHAESVNSTVQQWYRRCRYQLIEVPKVAVAERCTYVLQALANSDA